MSFSANQQQKPFWRQGDEASRLKGTVERINKYRDSSTSADELLRFLQYLILPALLLYSAVLGFCSYLNFFQNSFSPTVSMIAAFLLAAVIEIGKSRMGVRALQKPFLEGFGVIFSTPAQMVLWVGTIAFAAITFWMSIQNSTTGGKMLATKMAQDKQAVNLNFEPNTTAIDAQIAESRTAISKHQRNQWKGIVMIPSQNAIKAETRNIERLQQSRDNAIATQRADFERRRAQLDEQTEHGSNLFMAAGGYVEAIQLIVLFLIVSCQGVLLGKMDNPSPTGAKVGIGFKTGGSAATAETDPRRPIGFHAPKYDPLERRDMHENKDLIVFKQTGDLFKQLIENNKIVGYLYWSSPDAPCRTLGHAQVKSEYNTYVKRASAEGALDSTREKLKIWEQILKSFEDEA